MTKAGFQGIPVEVRHQVPAIRWDARAGRERLAFLTGRTRAVMRVITPDMFEPRASTARCWTPDGVVSLPDEQWLEGRCWRMQPHPTLEAFVADLAEGRAFESNRGLGFTQGLTLQGGRGIPDGADPAGITDRYDAEADRFVRASMATDFAFDGARGWIADHEAPGGEEPRRHRGLATGLHALMMAAEGKGVDREVEELSAPVRRYVARDSVAAVRADELPDAYRAMLRLCERLANLRRRGSKAATARMWAGQFQGRIAALPPPPVPQDDAASLAILI